MKKKETKIVLVDAAVDRVKIIEAPPCPLPLPTHNGEYTVEFDSYSVLYSNNVTGNLGSSWRAGGTSISCYKDNQFVGLITFYETTERMSGGYVDANGVVVIEYPIREFHDIMRILKTFSNLYLLFVKRDTDGVPLPHPVGALMTFQQKPIGV
jgi:hypothetical protein